MDNNDQGNAGPNDGNQLLAGLIAAFLANIGAAWANGITGRPALLPPHLLQHLHDKVLQLEAFLQHVQAQMQMAAIQAHLQQLAGLNLPLMQQQIHQLQQLVLPPPPPPPPPPLPPAVPEPELAPELDMAPDLAWELDANGWDDIQAGLLPGPNNVGFEFPGSQPAMLMLTRRQLYALLQFYDIVDGQIANPAPWSRQDLQARLSVLFQTSQTGRRSSRWKMLRTDADGLVAVIEKTWSVAQGISGKVRQLDLEQSRVKTTLQLLDDVQELKVSHDQGPQEGRRLQ
ncbi:hypothetical protein BC831DRAFT_511196 [Entophlyctis helioformis]|nr:hypothetical protein BC831DRAFT_511196 [Entophlyctis helioformis]